MPIPSPFYSRTKAINQLQEWSEWAGYFAAGSYQLSTEIEYFAVRNSAGLLDVSPLYKYEISGPDAEALVNRIMTRDMLKCKVGQVMYGPWCNEYGHVIDDGTIARLAKDRYRITAADPNFKWFQDVGYGMDATVKDVSTELAALALQGPNSRDILNAFFGDRQLDKLAYYHWIEKEFSGKKIMISRTGFTGDLGYELWVSKDNAISLWDAVMEAGQPFGLTPIGLAALDMTRIEAGLLLIEVDYTSARNASIASQNSSPYELGLGWAINLKVDDFIGKRALSEQKRKGLSRKFVGLEISWESLEEKFGDVDLPPQVAGRASRDPLPIYSQGKQIGQATSVVFSPVLKRYIALATIEQTIPIGAKIDIEVTVEYTRQRAQAKVVKSTFFNPARKKAIIDA